MDRYGYVLKKGRDDKKETNRYHRADLMLMTTFQLRELCSKEKIINGIVDPLDKEELIRVIMRYRGADEYFLIQKPDANGIQAVEHILKEIRLQ